MKGALSILIPLAVLTALGVGYYWFLTQPERKNRRLQIVAYSTRDLSVNDSITSRDFYTSFEIRPMGYSYRSPKGRFAKVNISAYTQLSDSNVVSSKRSFIISESVEIPVNISKLLARVLKAGDEIALSINGRIFPERDPEVKSFTVLDVISSEDQDMSTVLLEVAAEHFSDSIWFRSTTDHIVPIVISHSAPGCPPGMRPVWVRNLAERNGKYVCKPFVKANPMKDCECDSTKKR